jgi:phosphate transport system substrate-binding protein
MGDKSMTQLSRLAAAAVVALGATFAAAPGQAQEITGAGATFPAPIYTKWAEAFEREAHVRLNFQAIGSGGGQNQIINRTVDFGASDAPVEAPRLASANLLQFPAVMGSIVVIVNLEGVQANQLRLTGPILADIYLGRVTRWNDQRITSINPGVTLPNIAIAPVYRADGSGTTFVFTSYLSAVSPQFNTDTGANVSVQWAAGTGARGNDGVAGTVRNTRGGIGYVENIYATQNHLITTQLQNRDGQFVTPTSAAYQAAAAAGDWEHAQNFAVSLINMPGATSWPIVSATFILLPKNPTDATRSANVMRFFNWAYSSGGQLASELDYIPLPAPVIERVRAAWRAEIRGPNGQPVFAQN